MSHEGTERKLEWAPRRDVAYACGETSETIQRELGTGIGNRF